MDDPDEVKDKLIGMKMEFSLHQLEVLQYHYDLNSNPNIEEIKQFAVISELSEIEVRDWFEKSRLIEKRLSQTRVENNDTSSLKNLQSVSFESQSETCNQALSEVASQREQYLSFCKEENSEEMDILKTFAFPTLKDIVGKVQVKVEKVEPVIDLVQTHVSLKLEQTYSCFDEQQNQSSSDTLQEIMSVFGNNSIKKEKNDLEHQNSNGLCNTEQNMKTHSFENNVSKQPPSDCKSIEREDDENKKDTHMKRNKPKANTPFLKSLQSVSFESQSETCNQALSEVASQREQYLSFCKEENSEEMDILKTVAFPTLKDIFGKVQVKVEKVEPVIDLVQSHVSLKLEHTYSCFDEQQNQSSSDTLQEIMSVFGNNSIKKEKNDLEHQNSNGLCDTEQKMKTHSFENNVSNQPPSDCKSIEREDDENKKDTHMKRNKPKASFGTSTNHKRIPPPRDSVGRTECMHQAVDNMAVRVISCPSVPSLSPESQVEHIRSRDSEYRNFIAHISETS